MEQTNESNNAQHPHGNQNTQPPYGYQYAQQPYGNQYAQQPYANQYATHPNEHMMNMQRAMLKKENKFKPNMIDFIFAVITFVIGYMFSRWVLFAWLGWGVSAFATAYLLTVTAYLIKKDSFHNSAETWFWLTVTWLVGLSYALWENAGIAAIRGLFLFCSAVYYIMVASGSLLTKKSGNFLLADGVNAFFVVPFANFINQYVSFKALNRSENKNSGKKLPIFLGIVIALIMFLILIPLLLSADSGGFAIIVNAIERFFSLLIFEINFWSFMFYLFFALPIAAYIYGLISGSAHKKYTDSFKVESLKETGEKMHRVQSVTIFIALGAICILYLVFILSQIPYFFSAFIGVRPEGWLIYSEYARQGFFELCAIAAINLVVITVANLFAKNKRESNRLLKMFNIAISIITLVLIATAFSKMTLYISAYGLTMPRLLPCIFMVFLAAVFIALIVLQNKKFSIVRFSLILGSIIICLMCLSNPDAIVVRYNTNRYLSGTLQHYDLEILRRAGSAGVLPAYEVYNATTDQELKDDLQALFRWYQPRVYPRNTNQIFFEQHRARLHILNLSDTN